MTLVPASEQEGILKSLGLNPRDPKVQALTLVAQKYGLDLLLGEICIVKERIFVTHAGRLSAAHRSGVLDGIEVTVVEEPDRYVATAKVYRKDMRFPFSFQDFCRKDERVQDPRKRAITRAERNALYRAFPIGEWDDENREQPIVLSPERPKIVVPGQTAPGLAATLAEGREPGTTPTLGPGQSVVIRCREMGLSVDQRHALVRWVTEGRTESTKDLTAREASKAHVVLHSLQTTGETPWSTGSETTTSTSSSPPSSPSTAESTSATELPDGDAA